VALGGEFFNSVFGPPPAGFTWHRPQGSRSAPHRLAPVQLPRPDQYRGSYTGCTILYRHRNHHIL